VGGGWYSSILNQDTMKQTNCIVSEVMGKTFGMLVDVNTGRNIAIISSIEQALSWGRENNSVIHFI
jgi:hypothetical protein